jgi:hypothetical protein
MIFVTWLLDGCPLTPARGPAFFIPQAETVDAGVVVLLCQFNLLNLA